jgi:hypothetical protein
MAETGAARTVRFPRSGQPFIKRLEAIRVRGFVVQRYGLETYFSKVAVQAVFRPPLLSIFRWPTMPRALMCPDIPRAAMAKSPRP